MCVMLHRHVPTKHVLKWSAHCLRQCTKIIASGLKSLETLCTRSLSHCIKTSVLDSIATGRLIAFGPRQHLSETLCANTKTTLEPIAFGPRQRLSHTLGRMSRMR